MIIRYRRYAHARLQALPEPPQAQAKRLIRAILRADTTVAAPGTKTCVAAFNGSSRQPTRTLSTASPFVKRRTPAVRDQRARISHPARPNNP